MTYSFLPQFNKYILFYNMKDDKKISSVKYFMCNIHRGFKFCDIAKLLYYNYLVRSNIMSLLLLTNLAIASTESG